MSDLKELVVRLDTLLVGKPEAAEQAARQQAHRLSDPVSFAVGGEYYLSDGGYSRIVFHELSGRLSLTSNSRDAVKAQWDVQEVQDAVVAIESIVRNAIGFDEDTLQP